MNKRTIVNPNGTFLGKKMKNKTIDDEEKEKLWKEFYIENKGHINIGTKKDVIFWAYDKLLLNQIEARKEIKELEKKRAFWEKKCKEEQNKISLFLSKQREEFNKKKDKWLEERGRMAELLFKKGIKNW